MLSAVRRSNPSLEAFRSCVAFRSPLLVGALMQGFGHHVQDVKIRYEPRPTKVLQHMQFIGNLHNRPLDRHRQITGGSELGICHDFNR
jgi:hypothetical protein